MVEIFDSIRKYNFWGGNIVETGFERTAYTNKIIQYTEREYASLKNIDDNFPKYIVSMDDFHLPTNEGIEHITPWQVKEVVVPKGKAL